MIKSDVSAISIDMGDPGFGFGINYIYNLTSHVGLGVDVGNFSSAAHRMEDYPRTGANTTSYLRAFHGEAVARYLLMPQSRHHVSFLAGLGYASVNESVDFKGSPNLNKYELYDQTAGGLSVSAGAEYSYEITPNWSMGLDLRWRYLSAAKNFKAVSGENGNLQAGSLLNFGLSLSRKFGGAS